MAFNSSNLSEEWVSLQNRNINSVPMQLNVWIHKFQKDITEKNIFLLKTT